MPRRIDAGRFFDDGAARPAPKRLEADEFFDEPASAHAGRVDRLMGRLAGRWWSLGLILTGLGFFAVFINQSSIIYQIVFGAPIFEEFLKFGLALLLFGWVRFATFRFPGAVVVGAGFGVMEHVLTYPGEHWGIFLGRILFHAGATLLSMVTYHHLEASPYPIARWGSTVPATVIHYLNNGGQVLLILPSLASPIFGAVGLALAAILVASSFVLAVVLVFAPGPYVRWAERQARRLSRDDAVDDAQAESW